jgi:hypothetical protein
MTAEWDYQKHLCRFLENHDEPRAAEEIGLNNKAAALVMLTAPGMHLVHQDQMEGFRKKIPVQLIRQAPEPSNNDLAVLYKKLFILQKNRAFQEGNIERLDLNVSNNSHCFGFHRFTKKEHAFVLANFSPTGIAIEFRHPSLKHIAIDKLNILSTDADKNRDDVHLEGPIIRVPLSPHEGVVITF